MDNFTLDFHCLIYDVVKSAAGLESIVRNVETKTKLQAGQPGMSVGDEKMAKR